jgi:hypothetical protein
MQGHVWNILRTVGTLSLVIERFMLTGKIWIVAMFVIWMR